MTRKTRVNDELGSPGGPSSGNPLPWSGTDAILLISLLALPSVIYWPALSFRFVYDDAIFIVENPLISSWKSIPTFFTQSLTSHLDPGTLPNYYRPFLLLWLLVNRKLWGLNAFGWHLSTLSLHVLVTLSVYLLARRIFRDRLSAALAAAVFAVHPIHVETVAWVMGFPDSLVTLAVITSFLCFVKGRVPGRHNAAWLAGSTLLYGVAILTRENAITLPILVAAYEWLYFSPSDDRSCASGGRARIHACLRAVTPYLVVTGIYLVARVVVLQGFSHTVTTIPPGTLLQTLPLVIWTYLKHLCWPIGLSAFYDVPYVDHLSLSNFWLPAAAVLAAGAGLAWWARKSRQAAFAAVWWAIPVLPVLNLALLPTGEHVHDRYVYLPSVGFVLLLAMGLRRLGSGGRQLLGQPAVPAVAGLILVGMLGFGTISYGRFWSDNLTLYRRGAAVAPGNDIVTNNLANELVARGRYDDAVKLYERVLARRPDFWLSNYNLGYSFYKLNRLAEAELFLTRAVAINPTDPDQYVYLGLTRFKMGRLDEAESDLRRAIALKPDGVGYHFALAMLLKARGELTAALGQLRTELLHHPQQGAAQDQMEEIQALLERNAPGSSKPADPTPARPSGKVE